MIWKLNNKFNNELEIVTRGTDFGVDKTVKDICKIFEIKRSEFIPRFQQWNYDCVEKKFLFNQKYHPKYYSINDKKFLEYCDYVFLYIKKTDKILQYISEKNKKIAIIYV